MPPLLAAAAAHVSIELAIDGVLLEISEAAAAYESCIRACEPALEGVWRTVALHQPFLPAILLTVLGSSISLTVSNMPIVVQDLDATPLSRKYIETFQASLTFQVLALAPSEQPEYRAAVVAKASARVTWKEANRMRLR